MVDHSDNGSTDETKIVSIRPDAPDTPRTYERTMVDNSRRYSTDECKHRGPYLLDRKLATVECRDCGALLNPLYVLELLCYRETYWNIRQRDLAKYLAEINKQIDERSRTKCTHCGNMTAIRFKGEMPKTWVPERY